MMIGKVEDRDDEEMDEVLLVGAGGGAGDDEGGGGAATVGEDGEAERAWVGVREGWMWRRGSWR